MMFYILQTNFWIFYIDYYRFLPIMANFIFSYSWLLLLISPAHYLANKWWEGINHVAPAYLQAGEGRGYPILRVQRCPPCCSWRRWADGEGEEGGSLWNRHQSLPMEQGYVLVGVAAKPVSSPQLAEARFFHKCCAKNGHMLCFWPLIAEVALLD